MLTLKPSDFHPAYKSQVKFDHTQKTKSIDPQTKNKVSFDPAHKNQVDVNPIAEIKSISIPTLISSRFRFSDTKTHFISLLTLNTSYSRPLPKN